MPAAADLLGHPRGGQVRLRAGPIEAADVDADRPVGRGAAPGGHRSAGGGGAGVEPEAGELRGGVEPPQANGPGGRRRAIVIPRIDQDRPSPPDRARRTALAGARRSQVDRPAIEAHAEARVLREADDGPRDRGVDRLAAKVDGPAGLAGGSALAGEKQQRGSTGQQGCDRAAHLSPQPFPTHIVSPARVCICACIGRTQRQILARVVRQAEPGRARARGPRRPSAGCGPRASRAAGRRSAGWPDGPTAR